MIEPWRASDAVARTLLSDALCVECIMAKTGLDLDPVVDAIRIVEENFQLSRTWGRCRLCSKTNHAVLKVA